MNFESYIRLQCGALPPERLQVLQFDRFDLSSVRLGVVFVVAEWSAPAVAWFREFCHLAADAATDPFSILVLNGDDLDHVRFLATFGEISHGWGESIWVKEGKVIYFHKGAKEMNAKSVIEAKISEMGKS